MQTHLRTTPPALKYGKRVPQLRKFSKPASGVAHCNVAALKAFVHCLCACLRREINVTMGALLDKNMFKYSIKIGVQHTSHFI